LLAWADNTDFPDDEANAFAACFALSGDRAVAAAHMAYLRATTRRLVRSELGRTLIIPTADLLERYEVVPREELMDLFGRLLDTTVTVAVSH